MSSSGRAAPRLGPERRRQDQPARGDGPAGVGSIAPDDGRRGADPLGHRTRAGRRGAWAPTSSRWRSSAPGRVERPGASGSASTAWAGGRAGLAGLLRVVVFAPEEMLLIAGSPSLRRAADRPAGLVDLADVRRRPGDLRPGAPAAEQPAACDPEEGASRDELRFWDGAFLDAGAAIVTERRRLLDVLAGPLAAAHAEIAPDEAARRD